MIKAALKLCKRVITSRFGQFLFVVHLVIVIYIFSQMTSYSDVPCHEQFHSPGWSTIAGRSFHWTYEPLLTIVFLLDLPSFFVSGIAELLFLPSDWCDHPKSWFMALDTLFFASIQWLVIGFCLESLFRGWKNPK